jgi:hypothetical protein
MYRPEMPWEPMLEGELAEEARIVVRAILDDLDQIEPARRRPVDEALLWAYVAGAFDDEATARRYVAAVAAFQDRLEAPFGSFQLYGGLAGAAWVLAHISDNAEEFLQEADRTLTDALREPWRGDHDLIVGLTGLGVYFVERLRAGAVTARPGIARVVEQLSVMADVLPDGAAWSSRQQPLPGSQLTSSPSGRYDVGVAHGAPGVIALLGAVAALRDPELEPTAAQARELCDRASRWLRAQRLPPHPWGRFPGWVTPEVQNLRPTRTAWCYGDPGIAAAMWTTAIRTGADTTEWRELALEAAGRPAELCIVQDAPLCHGAVGLAHLNNRFFQASGDERFREAARGWFERGLAMRRPGEGVGGFTRARGGPPGAELQLVHEAVPDFLDGAIGIALALLAGLAREEPGWDRLMLCDLPPSLP